MTALQLLQELFRAPRPEGTARVLTSPSTMSKEAALKVLDEMEIEPVLRDLAAAAAREFANSLSAWALRPADFVVLPDLPERISDRIVKALKEDPEAFAKVFVEHLSLRG